ncbi:DUF4339 domain-containing protein [Wenyingzhuangia sp. IMCC45533]
MSRKYFIYKKEKEGPYTYKQLRKLNIDDTYSVWFDGLKKWIPITQVPELDDVFISTPPDFGDVIEKSDQEIKVASDPAYKYISEEENLTKKEVVEYSDPAFKYIGKNQNLGNSRKEAKKKSRDAWLVALFIGLVVMIIALGIIEEREDLYNSYSSYYRRKLDPYKVTGYLFGRFAGATLFWRLIFFIFRPKVK